MDIKEKTDKILKEFGEYCEHKDCERICPTDIYERCFAEYVAKTYMKDDNDGLGINGIIYEKDLKLTAEQIEDLFFDWLESLGLEFGGGINYVNCNEEK